MNRRRAFAILLWTCLASAGAEAAFPAQQRIGLSTSSVVINAPLGGPDPDAAIVVLENIGSGKLNYTAAPVGSPGWLFVAPPSGKLNPNGTQNLSITVQVTGLTLPEYTGTIRVTDTEFPGTPVDIGVTLKLSSTPKIGTSTGLLTFAAPVGGPDPVGKPLTIQNTGGGTLDWTAAGSPTWISINPAFGSLSPGASRTVTVSVDVTGLPAGLNTGAVTITAPGASNTPQTVDVQLTLSQKAKIGLAPATLTFDGPKDGASPPSKLVSLTNQGGEQLKWKASASPPWLQVAPISGTLQPGIGQALTVSVVTTGLGEGTHNGTILVEEDVLSNPIPSGSVAVTLNINADPKIGLNPTSALFSVPLESGNSSPKAVSVTNTGQGTLEWTASGGAAWLKVQPTTGSLTSLASEPVLLSVNSKGLAAGTYTTTLTIADPDASNTSELVTIEMVVKESGLPLEAPAGQCGLLGLDALVLVFLLRRRKGGRS